jgi:hypothetical protein
VGQEQCDAVGGEFITKEIKEWRNNKETQIRSKRNKAAYYVCCTTRTGVHVLYTELSSYISGSVALNVWDFAGMSQTYS